MNIVKRRLPPKLSVGNLAGFFLQQLSFLLKESVFLYYCVSARSRILIVYLLILTQSVCEVVTVQYPYATRGVFASFSWGCFSFLFSIFG